MHSVRPWPWGCSRGGGSLTGFAHRVACRAPNRPSDVLVPPLQPLLRDLKSQVAPSANALRFLPPPKGTFPRYHPAWGPVPFSPQQPLLGPREASPHDAGSRAEGRGRGVDPSLLCTSLLISKDLVPHSLLLCSPEYDIEAAQEKDRQAFKPTVILPPMVPNKSMLIQKRE